MSIATKNILISIACFFFGAIVSGAVVFYVLKTNLKNSSPQDAIVDIGQSNADWSMRKYGVILPASKASPEYKQEFDLAFNELDILDSTNRISLFPLITGIKDQFNAKNYDGINSAILKIRGINEVEKKREIIAASYLKNLDSINKKTVDQETNRLTADFILKATKLNDAYVAYSGFIDKFVSGRIDEKSISEGKEVMANLVSAKKDFLEANKNLIEFFVQVVKNEKTSSSTNK